MSFTLGLEVGSERVVQHGVEAIEFKRFVGVLRKCVGRSNSIDVRV